jgi:hypothetical protein
VDSTDEEDRTPNLDDISVLLQPIELHQQIAVYHGLEPRIPLRQRGVLAITLKDQIELHVGIEPTFTVGKTVVLNH